VIFVTEKGAATPLLAAPLGAQFCCLQKWYVLPFFFTVDFCKTYFRWKKGPNGGKNIKIAVRQLLTALCKQQTC